MPGALGTSRLARLVAAFDDGSSLLEQARSVLRACPDEAVLVRYGVTDPADLPAGAADRCLLAAYADLAERPLEVSARCDACGARSAFGLTPESVGAHRWVCRVTGAGGGLREPSYADLLACAGDPSALVTACRVGAADAKAGSWAELESVDMTLSGPLRSVCAECGAPLVVDVDVVPLVLAGLAGVCAGVDREVHLLASAYGWDLATIESLPDARRQRLAALVSGVAG